MLIDEWRPHIEDGLVYKLIETRPYERTETGYVPRILCLLCNQEWQRDTDKIVVDEEYDVEVDISAFNDFDHLCSFSKEVAAILECDPQTIVKAI